MVFECTLKFSYPTLLSSSTVSHLARPAFQRQQTLPGLVHQDHMLALWGDNAGLDGLSWFVSPI